MTVATIDADNDVVIEKNGEPATVVMSYARYEALLEELEELQDSLLAVEAELRLARGEATVRPWIEYEAEQGADGG